MWLRIGKSQGEEGKKVIRGGDVGERKRMERVGGKEGFGTGVKVCTIRKGKVRGV